MKYFGHMIFIYVYDYEQWSRWWTIFKDEMLKVNNLPVKESLKVTINVLQAKRMKGRNSLKLDSGFYLRKKIKNPANNITS